MNLNKTLQELQDTIARAYTEGVTMQEAERLAAHTLSVRLQIADHIKSSDLDARMKKHGVKAIRAQVYLEQIAANEKKPTEAWLESAVNMSDLVKAEETLYAESDTDTRRLETYSDVLKDAHIFFRKVMGGSFE